MSSDNTTLLLLVGAGVGVWYMYTRKLGPFAPATPEEAAAAAAAAAAGGSLLAPTGSRTSQTSTSAGDPTPTQYSPPPTVPGPVLPDNPYSNQLPVYNNPVIAPTPEGVPVNWQGSTTYAAKLQLYLASKGMANEDTYRQIYICVSNVSGGGSRSADAWGVILGQCLGETAGPPGALVTGSSDTSPMSLSAYWRYISPFGVPSGLGGFQRPLSMRYAQ